MTGGVQQLVGETLDAYPISGLDAPFNARGCSRTATAASGSERQRRGLIHVHQGRVDRFTPADGLSSDYGGRPL